MFRPFTSTRLSRNFAQGSGRDEINLLMACGCPESEEMADGFFTPLLFLEKQGLYCPVALLLLVY